MIYIAAMPTKEPKGSVNKSAWIRQQPTTLTARELVNLAKKEGFHITQQQVYTVRHEAKVKNAAAGNTTTKAPVAHASSTKAENKNGGGELHTFLSSSQDQAADIRRAFLKLATQLGTVEMRRLIDLFDKQSLDRAVL